MSKRIIAAMIAIAIGAIAQASEYDRDAFGNGWLDPDGNGNNGREDALDQARTTISLWWDPYTGEMVFNPGELDIDHIVPLRWAWDRGASAWTQERREAFANDPDNLIPVIAGANRSKGAKGPDEWMPPNVAYWRVYLIRFVHIAGKYALPITERELAIYACLAAQAEHHRNGIKLAAWSPCR